MIQYTQLAGSWQFTLGYLISQILDACNFIFTQTMLMQNLKAQSRGVVMSLNTMMWHLGVLSLLQTQVHVQNQYGTDYGKGGQVIYSIFFGVLGLYWVVLVVYVRRNSNQVQE